jgi:hypothetical protein
VGHAKSKLILCPSRQSETDIASKVAKTLKGAPRRKLMQFAKTMMKLKKLHTRLLARAASHGTAYTTKHGKIYHTLSLAPSAGSQPTRPSPFSHGQALSSHAVRSIIGEESAAALDDAKIASLIGSMC